MVLNGRAALCAGRDDMSSDEDEGSEKDKKDSQPGNHKFTPLDTFKKVLESGKIPDAAMIHAARKRRQKARELGKNPLGSFFSEELLLIENILGCFFKVNLFPLRRSPKRSSHVVLRKIPMMMALRRKNALICQR